MRINLDISIVICNLPHNFRYCYSYIDVYSLTDDAIMRQIGSKLKDLRINNKWTDITMNDLLVVASKMNIKKPREIIEKTTDVVAHWSGYATKLEIPKETIDAIQSTLITRL